MNTSTSTTTTTCPLAKENGTGMEIISPTGSELTSISLDVEQANDDASASAVDASPKAKTMKEVLWRYGYGRGLAVSVVIALALAGKGFVARAHNDLTGTDDMMMNVDLGIDSSKQVALLELKGDGNNVAVYDLKKVDGEVSTVRTLEQGQDPIIYEFTKVGNGKCTDSNNNEFVVFWFHGSLHVDECKTQCGECPGQGQATGRGLRGFFYWYGNCYCLLDDGDLFDKSVCTGIIDVFSGSGTGAICKVDPLGWGSAECWKVVDSNLQCPTPAPTNEPTSSPSMSPTQSPSTAPKPKHLRQWLPQHLRLHLRQWLQQHLRLHLRQWLPQHLRLHLRQWLGLKLPQRTQQLFRLHSLPQLQQMQTPNQVKLRKLGKRMV